MWVYLNGHNSNFVCPISIILWFSYSLINFRGWFWQQSVGYNYIGGGSVQIWARLKNLSWTYHLIEFFLNFQNIKISLKYDQQNSSYCRSNNCYYQVLTCRMKISSSGSPRRLAESKGQTSLMLVHAPYILGNTCTISHDNRPDQSHDNHMTYHSSPLPSVSLTVKSSKQSISWIFLPFAIGSSWQLSCSLYSYK